jgi:hypothetical protein
VREVFWLVQYRKRKSENNSRLQRGSGFQACEGAFLATGMAGSLRWLGDEERCAVGDVRDGPSCEGAQPSTFMIPAFFDLDDDDTEFANTA